MLNHKKQQIKEINLEKDKFEGLLEQMAQQIQNQQEELKILSRALELKLSDANSK